MKETCKRALSLLLAVMMTTLLLASCGQQASGSSAGSSAASSGKDSNHKIAILYTDASQGEEPTRAFEQLKAEYGDQVVGSSFPSGEQEVLVSTALGLVADPDVAALLIFQEPAGASAAVKACRDVRPDVLYMAAVVAEDPDVVDEVFDVVVDPAKIPMGESIVKLAKEMGATTFVHYSFPRHMAMESLAQRHDVMKKTCEEVGIEFVDATSPDPLSDAGVTGTQQFILEDIPKKIAQYGKDTAFFGTNTAMMDVMVKAVVDNGGLLPSTCDPSPFQGFTSGLSIEIPEDKSNDPQYAVEQIRAKLADLGMTGRLATWPVSSSMLYFNSIFEYAKEWADGTISEKTDVDALTKAFDSVADKMAGMDCNIYLNPWEANGKTYSHLLGFQMDFITL